jgi:hypothetical protein
MHANGPQGCECVETDPLALHLIKLAANAGWKPDECIEFAREAYKFVTSTLSEVAVHQTVVVAKNTARPEWSSDLETRRKALQELADRNLMMKEAARILGVSLSSWLCQNHSAGRSSARLIRTEFRSRMKDSPRSEARFFCFAAATASSVFTQPGSEAALWLCLPYVGLALNSGRFPKTAGQSEKCQIQTSGHYDKTITPADRPCGVPR